MRRSILGMSLLAVLTFTSTLPAAAVDALLPPDTEIVVNLNVRQLLDSALLKRLGVGQASEMLKNIDQVQTILTELGFDPFTDLERLTIASPGGKAQDRGLVIVRGRFNREKFKTRGEQAAKENSDVVKLHQAADGQGVQQAIFEVAPSEGDVPAFFVAVASKDVLLASPGKDYVVDALKKLPGKAVAMKNRDMQALLEKVDDRQSLSIAAVGSALANADVPEMAKETLAKLDALGGGVTVTDGLKMEIVFTTKNLDQAKEIDKLISDSLNQALGLLALLGGQKPELAPAIEFVKTLRATRSERTVTVRGQVGADVFDRLLDKGM